jgi:hypothetical protein
VFPARTPEKTRDLFAHMLDLDPSALPVSVEPKRRTLRDIIPRCVSCGNFLLPQSRGVCKTGDCNSYVCLRSRDCHNVHLAKHQQQEADKQAVDMALRNLPRRAKLSARRALQRQGARFFVMDEEAPLNTNVPGLFMSEATEQPEATDFRVMTEKEAVNAGLAF